MSKWDFCTLVENAGYNSYNCRIINEEMFCYKHILGKYKLDIYFSITEIEQAKNKNLYVKTKLDTYINLVLNME